MLNLKRTLLAATAALLVTVSSGCYCCVDSPGRDYCWKPFSCLHKLWGEKFESCGPGCGGCNSGCGCGERYYDEWCNDPPHEKCCPYDHCGHGGHGYCGHAGHSGYASKAAYQSAYPSYPARAVKASGGCACGGH